MESHLADDAATLLARVEPHLADEQRASQRIRILCLRGDVTGAHETLAEELRARRAPGFALKPALGAVRATFGFDALRLALEAAHDVVHPEAVRALVEVLVEADDRTGARRILDLVAGRTEAVVAACRGWLEVSAKAPEDRRAAEHLHSLQPDDAESTLLLARTMEAEARTCASRSIRRRCVRIEPTSRPAISSPPHSRRSNAGTPHAERATP